MIYQFLGRFHPLLVHIPIGVLVLAFLMEFFFPKKKKDYSYAIEISLLFGTISAILAATLGWLLSLSGEYDESLLNTHQWWGIALCLVSLLLWAFKKFDGNHLLVARAYKPLFFLTMLLLMMTGHFGGSLTHGEDYLFLKSIKQETGNKLSDTLKKKIQLNELTPTLTVYQDLITPVFDDKCISCHNDKKKKGNFQMQSYELLQKGGKSKKVMAASGVQNSELLRRMLIEKNDEKHMPPKGKRQLTKPEIDLIYWWVNNGALPDKKIVDVKTNDTIKAFLVNQDIEKLPELKLQKVKEATAPVLAQFQTIHWQVRPISTGSPFLEVNTLNVSTFSETHQTILLKIQPQLAWLLLGNTKITDQGMETIGKCSNLVKLNLQNTNITNASIKYINQLQQLEYLNINGTGINDAGLFQLKANKVLKKVFCWNTPITKSGIMKFKKANPLIEIDYFSTK